MFHNKLRELLYSTSLLMLWAVFCVIIVKFKFILIFALNIILVFVVFTLFRLVNRHRRPDEEQCAPHTGKFDSQHCKTS